MGNIIKRVVKGACGSSCILASGGALIQSLRFYSPLLLFIFVLSFLGGVWLCAEAVENREI